MEDQEKIQLIEETIEEFIEDMSLSDLSHHLISVCSELGINF